MLNQFSKDTIENFEVGSQASYNKLYTKPTWPGGQSGITIGIGFDLGYHSKPQIVTAWNSFIELPDMQRLIAVAGLTGAAAQAALPSVKNLVVFFIAATQVFDNNTLPIYEKLTLDIYPTADTLPANVFGMLVSLVYNRGNGLTGDRRTEMRNIVALVASRDVNGIADQFIAMQRLWPVGNGVYSRRAVEAKIIRLCA